MVEPVDVYDAGRLKSGTFEDKSWFRPVTHLWCQRAQPWLVLEDDTA
jgi:hypothetical protein